MVKTKSDYEKQLATQLGDALDSEKEYKEMLHDARKEITELKQLLMNAQTRGRIVQDFLYSLKYQTATLNRVFGVDVNNEGVLECKKPG